MILVNYQRYFILASLSNNCNIHYQHHQHHHILLSFPISFCLVPRFLHCNNFKLTEDPFYLGRFIYVFYLGFGCLCLLQFLHINFQLTNVDSQVGTSLYPSFSRKKLLKMRPLPKCQRFVIVDLSEGMERPLVGNRPDQGKWAHSNHLITSR